MPNIVTAQPQVFYNITEIGTTSTTGTTSILQITPNDGYTIAASQFACNDLEDVYTISFVNTSEPFAPGNKVNAVVTWAGTIALNQDTYYDLDISFDDTGLSYSSTQTNLDFIVKKHAPDFDLTDDFGTPAFDLLFCQSTGTSFPIADVTINGYHPELPTNISSFRVQKTVYGYEQVNVVRISVPLLEGSYYFDNNQPISISVDGAEGDFEFVPGNLNYDNYNKIYYQSGYIAYTPPSDTEENDDVVITVYLNDRVRYYATILEGQGNYSAISHEEQQINFATNIPTSNWFFEFADTWANAGETSSTSTSAYIDITAVPSDALFNRSQVITLRDFSYDNISRDTLTINQTIEPVIDLYVQTSPPGEYVLNDDPTQITSSSAAKVISRPNIGENTFAFAMNQGTQEYYEVQLDTSIMTEYCLYAQISTPGTPVTAEQLNTDQTFEIQNLLYPVNLENEPFSQYQETSFVNFDLHAWELVATGENNSSLLFKRKFYIRNQDRYGSDGSELTTADRVATITLTHPEYPNVSDSVTITQDKRSANGEDIKIKASTDSSYPAFTNTTVTVSSLIDDEGTYQVRMDGYENDFNLFNALTTDSNASNYKQYPDMSFGVSPTNTLTGTSIDDLYIINDTTWFNIADFEYNSSYDASSSDNDHQYSFKLQTSINDTYSTRTATVTFFHSENENDQTFVNANGYLIVTQTALPKLNAFIYPIDPDTYDNPDGSFASIVDGGDTRDVYIIYNGNTPTIGIWTPPVDDEFGFYTPLAVGDTNNGLSYTSPTTVVNNYNGGYVQKTVVSLAANPVGNPARNITLGFWGLNSSPQDDEPSDTISFYQPAAFVDPNIYYTICNTSGSGVQSGDTAGTVEFNVTVSNYSATDFPNDNLPVVELVATDVFGNVIEDTNSILSNNISITVNPFWNTGDGQHTHTVTVSHTALPDGNQFFFDLRTRHQFIEQFPGGASTASVILTGAETLYISSASATIPIPFQSNQLNYGNTGSPKAFSILPNATTFNLNISTNFGGETEDENAMIYHSPVDYIVGRFITSDDQTSLTTKVFENGAVENANNQTYDIPHTFYVVGNQNFGNSRHIIESITKSKSRWFANNSYGYTGTSGSEEGINWVSYGAWPNKNYTISFNLAPNETGYDLTSYIGIWTGNRAPKTNLVNPLRPFLGFPNSGNEFSSQTNRISCSTTNNKMGQTVQEVYTGVSGGVAAVANIGSSAEHLINVTSSGQIKFNQSTIPVQGTAGLFDCDLFVPQQKYSLILFNILDPLDLTADNSTYGTSKVLGIEYTITDYEAHPQSYDQSTNFGISTGWWQSPAGLYNDADFPSTDEIRDSLRGNGNGTYEGKIRMNSGIRCFGFFARANTRFTISNIKIWEIDNDKGLQPGQSTVTNLDGTTTNNRPNDIIKIVQAPVTPALNFGVAEQGTPLSGIANLGAAINPVSTFSEALINNAAAPYAINLISYEGQNPVLKIWDGTNNSDITSTSWTWGAFGPQGGGTGYDEDEGMFLFGVEENDYISPETLIGENREITFGLYNYEPASSTQAPLATLKIIQQYIPIVN